MTVQITTTDNLLLALRNMANHYSKTNDERRARMITNHIDSMRDLWINGRFFDKASLFIKFEEGLRAHRCLVNSPGL